MPEESGTRERLLELAQRLAQTRGLNAFSFRDLADGVGIRAASVHHHFRTKEDLARELMARYRTAFVDSLRAIDARTGSSRRKLEEFTALFLETLRQGNRLCLCGKLATDFSTLSGPVQEEVRFFFVETEEWLRATLEKGERSGELRLTGSATTVARTFLAALEGAMIAARSFADESRLEQAGSWLIAAMANEPTGAKPPRARAVGKPDASGERDC